MKQNGGNKFGEKETERYTASPQRHRLTGIVTLGNAYPKHRDLSPRGGDGSCDTLIMPSNTDDVIPRSS